MKIKFYQKGQNMLKIINNPIDLVFEAFEELYPNFKAHIQFDPDLRGLEYEECGFCTFDNNEIYIGISTSIPFEAMAETLGHELAHAIIWKDYKGDGHTKEWEDVFNQIFEKYMEIGEKRFNKY